MSALLDAKERETIRLRHQVAWSQRQLSGDKSERRMPEPGQAERKRCRKQLKPMIERFFTWTDEQSDQQRFVPGSPFFDALAYIRERQIDLSAARHECVPLRCGRAAVA